MTNALINAIVAGLLGIIAFVVLKQVATAQDTTGWSGLDVTFITTIPTVMGIVVIVGMFMLLSKLRGQGGE